MFQSNFIANEKLDHLDNIDLDEAGFFFLRITFLQLLPYFIAAREFALLSSEILAAYLKKQLLSSIFQ